MAGSVVLGRAGSSPNKSILGAGAGGLPRAAGGARLVVPFFTDPALSSLAFSCTTLSGCGGSMVSLGVYLCRGFVQMHGHTTSSSPSPPRVEGSGMGPSMTHRFESYLVRIKFSILLS